MINVSQLITNRRFSQTITVKRNQCAIVKYKPVIKETELTLKGVIAPADQKALEMLPEADRVSGTISVFTREQLYLTGDSPEGDYISDIIIHHGQEYKLQAQMDYSDYGYYQSICTLMSR